MRLQRAGHTRAQRGMTRTLRTCGAAPLPFVPRRLSWRAAQPKIDYLPSNQIREMSVLFT